MYSRDTRMAQHPQINQEEHIINKMKAKKTDGHLNKCRKKAFNKTQHPFMIQTLNKMGMEVIYLNIIKAAYDKLTVSIILTQ